MFKMHKDIKTPQNLTVTVALFTWLVIIMIIIIIITI